MLNPRRERGREGLNCSLWLHSLTLSQHQPYLESLSLLLILNQHFVLRDDVNQDEVKDHEDDGDDLLPQHLHGRKKRSVSILNPRRKGWFFGGDDEEQDSVYTEFLMMNKKDPGKEVRNGGNGEMEKRVRAATSHLDYKNRMKGSARDRSEEGSKSPLAITLILLLLNYDEKMGKESNSAGWGETLSIFASVVWSEHRRSERKEGDAMGRGP